MRTLKLTVAYDGTNYVGWQRQTNGTSIQQLIEEAFVPLVGDAGRAPGVAGAGRTDAGVHAAGQVASVNVEFGFAADAVQRALNVRLPLDIRILSVEDVSLGFHARFQARGKSYRYRLATPPVMSPFNRSFVWHVPDLRDVAAMRRAAQSLVGRHDFASFQGRGSTMLDTTRTVERLEIIEQANEVIVEVTGDGFLRHMVRIMVGSIVEVGCGLRAADTIPVMLIARDRRAGGPTAPAQGLTLLEVRY